MQVKLSQLDDIHTSSDEIMIVGRWRLDISMNNQSRLPQRRYSTIKHQVVSEAFTGTSPKWLAMASGRMQVLKYRL